MADDIGKWVFTLQARNSANLTAGEVLEIQVWQHKAERTFHHHFRLQIEPEFSDDEKDLPRVRPPSPFAAFLSQSHSPAWQHGERRAPFPAAHWFRMTSVTFLSQ